MKSEQNNMHIFFASDNNFVMPLTVAISSILRNSKKDDFHNFYILDKDITDTNKQKILKLKKIKDFLIEFIKVDDSTFKNCPLTKECSHIPLSTYYRYLIPKLKPDLEKVLFLDCDILVCKSLSELWNKELGNTYCGVVEDMYENNLQDTKRLNIDGYFNAGVLLMNNKKLASENYTDLLFENTQKLYKENLLVWQDQDVLNYSFKDNVTWLNPCFNYQQHNWENYHYTKYTPEEMSQANSNITIIHYNTGAKPWHCGHFKFFKIRYLYEMLLDGFWIKVFLSVFGKDFIQKMFSVKNENKNHKIIRLLGIKLKIKRN